MPDLPVRGGGGVNPTSMAQNDTHVALIILTTQMWGGGIIGGKNFFGPKFVFLRLRRQHPFLHKTKGPTRNPISPTPPPSFGGRPCHPPSPPQSNFQVAKLRSPPSLRVGKHCPTVCNWPYHILIDGISESFPYGPPPTPLATLRLPFPSL